ncbi:hypothetical protein CPBF1521_06600 [Xanthomonas arboricola pv. juglandis]|nr:hypothetical protein CPBF1521_06600 [Xanthomonas arboricola pv. juglandis]SYZ58743.1 hypothetical protein CPBF427_08380 [Xanthomonas arboricola pv. juglandis]
MARYPSGPDTSSLCPRLPCFYPLLRVRRATPASPPPVRALPWPRAQAHHRAAHRRDLQGFARLAWPCVDAPQGCAATPARQPPMPVCCVHDPNRHCSPILPVVLACASFASWARHHRHCVPRQQVTLHKRNALPTTSATCRQRCNMQAALQQSAHPTVYATRSAACGVRATAPAGDAPHSQLRQPASLPAPARASADAGRSATSAVPDRVQ